MLLPVVVLATCCIHRIAAVHIDRTSCAYVDECPDPSEITYPPEVMEKCMTEEERAYLHGNKRVQCSIETSSPPEVAAYRATCSADNPCPTTLINLTRVWHHEREEYCCVVCNQPVLAACCKTETCKGALPTTNNIFRHRCGMCDVLCYIVWVRCPSDPSPFPDNIKPYRVKLPQCCTCQTCVKSTAVVDERILYVMSNDGRESPP